MSQDPAPMSEDRIISQQDWAEAKAASDAIKGCWVIGVILLVAGGLVVGLASDEQAPTGAFVIGLLVAGVGQVIVLIGVIASGVRLGIRATRA